MGLQETLAALADPTRRRILQALQNAGRLTTGQLADQVGLSPSALSYHLAKLKKAGLVYEARRGNFIDWELDLTVLDEAIFWMKGLKKEERDEEAEDFVLDPGPAADGGVPGGAAGPA